MNIKTLLVSALILLTFSNCASIVSKSNWPFSVDSNPSGAKVTITNRKGVEVYSGRTPAAMKLKSGAGFFTKESYTVTLALNGFETKTINVECKLNGWYFGNIVFGGLVGLLIVDPATGAMYKLENDGINTSLNKSATGTVTLNILNKNEIPQDWESHLVKLN